MKKDLSLSMEEKIPVYQRAVAQSRAHVIDRDGYNTWHTSIHIKISNSLFPALETGLCSCE